MKRFDQWMKNQERQMALETALTLLSCDMETTAPEGAAAYTSRAMGILSSMLQEEVLREENRTLLQELSEDTSLSAEQAAMVRRARKEEEQLSAIPPEEYRDYSELLASSTMIWARAKRENDFSLFEPTLEKVVEGAKKFASYRAKDGQAPYDVLLEDYEETFTMEVLDPFFDLLRRELVPLLRELSPAAEKVDDSFLHRPCSVEKQKEFSDFLLDTIGFDRSRGVALESEHPFTTNLHNHDVRITNHFYEDQPASAVFSAIHEGGHALYEQGIRDDLTQTPAGCGTSCGMHESQSRFYENMVGRSEAFWKPIYGRFQDTFPDVFGEVPLHDFILAINRPQPGLIRIEADELTYNLHIMVRYELEKRLFDGSLAVKDLPAAWADEMEELLGVRPEGDAEGVLQDIHWAQGSFGYFPSYALGNAFAAQILHHLKEIFPVEEMLEEGRLSEITEYLRIHIHQYGGVKTSRELLREITGEDFNPQYYVDYLKEKYRGLYQQTERE